MQHPPRLADRLALITGATRGIGRAVAVAYARQGAHLILVGRTAGALEEVDDEVREFGRPATLNGRVVEVSKLKAQGLGVRAIARELKMPPSSVYKALQLAA